MLKTNHLKLKLQQGQSVIGTWSVMLSGAVVDAIGSSGLDFVVLDGEHGPLDYFMAQDLIAICESREMSPVIRIPCVSQEHILKSLDIGSHNIHIPNISNSSQLNEIIKYAKYPPVGQRGYSPFTRASNFGPGLNEYTERANQNTLLTIHIESTFAAKNIDEYLDYNEIDIFFLGVYDLSKELGFPGNIDHPEVKGLLENLVRKINQAGKVAGSIFINKDQLKFYQTIGIRYLAYSADCTVLKTSYETMRSVFLDARNF